MYMASHTHLVTILSQVLTQVLSGWKTPLEGDTCQLDSCSGGAAHHTRWSMSRGCQVKKGARDASPVHVVAVQSCLQAVTVTVALCATHDAADEHGRQGIDKVEIVCIIRQHSHAAPGRALRLGPGCAGHEDHVQQHCQLNDQGAHLHGGKHVDVKWRP